MRAPLEASIGPSVRLGAGALAVAAFIAQSSLILVALECLALFLLAIAAGKRIKPLYFLSLAFFVAFFELLSPRGLTLATVLGWRITQDALLSGAEKGLTIVGSVAGSLAAIRRDLRLPGRAGWFLSQVLVRFDAIMAARRRVKAEDLVASLDELLFDLFPPDRFGSGGGFEAGDGRASERTNARGWFLAFLVVLPFYLALPLSALLPF